MCVETSHIFFYKIPQELERIFNIALTCFYVLPSSAELQKIAM